MIKIGDLRIYWQHFRAPKSSEPRTLRPSDSVGSYTLCNIERNAEIVATAKAKLYYLDNFSKFKGRKESLKRAIAQLDLSKEERTTIWDEYKKTCKYRERNAYTGNKPGNTPE